MCACVCAYWHTTAGIQPSLTAGQTWRRGAVAALSRLGCWIQPHHNICRFSREVLSIMDKLVFSWKQSGVISTGNSQPTAVVMILSQYLWCRQKAQTAGSAQSSPKDLLFTTVE